jgi:hypothetical protein
VGFGPDHRVQAGLLAGAGQLHVQPVDVLAAGEADQRPPAGQPLRAMPGRGVGQVDTAVALPVAAAVQVPPRQGHLVRVVAVGADGERAALGVQGGDGAAGAVGDPQLADRVVPTHDPVADGELAVLDLQPLRAEPALEGQELLAVGVEPVDLGPPGRQHHHLLRGVTLGLLEGLPPVPQQRQGGRGLGLGGDDPVVGLVGRDGLLDQPGPHEFEGFAFPGVALPSVLCEFAGAQPQPQGAEAAAGVDGGQLPVVADQHHLGLAPLGVGQQLGELAAAEHAGLVDDQHRPRVQPLVARAELAEEAVAGGDVFEPLGLQADRGDSGRRAGEQPVAVQLPGVAGHP